MILPQIADSGPLSFEEFMEIALYHEPGGYYQRSGVRRVGQEGDFFTSISVGPAFGTLLAHRIHDLWQRNGSPATFTVVEPGPEEGQLCGDILRELAACSPGCHEAVSYHLIEPFTSKHAELRDKLAAPDPAKVLIHTSTEGIQGSLGLVLANEIFDALPVHLVELRDGRWHERFVTDTDGTLSWTTRPCENPALLAVLAPHTPHLPEGYQSEVCLSYQPLLESLASTIERGTLLVIDYGFSHADYYHPDRTTGTLQGYAAHKVLDDPLIHPGHCDLTTHLDFSRLLAGAEDAGLEPIGFSTQESFLTALAKPLFTDSSASASAPSFIRQFRTLTHPALLGGRFHVLELKKGEVRLDAPSQTGTSGLRYLRGEHP